MTPSKTHPARYRVYQFFTALKAMLPIWAGGGKGGLTTEDERLVRSILPAAGQQQLFARMSPNDQRHALAVARSLQQAGSDNPALLQAALLHDVGKSLGQPIIHRVLIVLLEAFWPAMLERLSTSPARARAWRRPFVVHAQHPAIGAEWAQSAGCDPLAVSLIARHQEILSPTSTETEDKLLAALQWADNSN
jgi:hypothetical protein